MIQIVFNTISAAEMAAMPIAEQLSLLGDFQSLPANPKDIDLSAFGQIERDGRTLYRHRSADHRLYFELQDGELIVHRVLHKNTIRDFLFRADLPIHDDEEETREFWRLIEEGQRAERAGPS